jgi:hypothetical protein
MIGLVGFMGCMIFAALVMPIDAFSGIVVFLTGCAFLAIGLYDLMHRRP